MSNEQQAVVQKVSNGHRGKYAITTLVNAGGQSIKGSITFLLEKPVWNEEYIPERGVFVMLSDLCKKQSGWRAMKARPWSTSDEITMSKGVFDEKTYASK